MRTYFAVGTISIMLLGCAAAAESKPAAETEWTSLGGSNLDAWDPKSEAPPDVWDIKDGVLTDARGVDATWIRTKREFDDFELRLEFRMTEFANSGVFLRAPAGYSPHEDGLEVQLRDDAESTLPLDDATGALLLETGPTKRVSKKFGEWQTLHVRCAGPRVTVTLNGTKVVDEDLSQNTERATNHPGRKSKKGYIGLQSRGNDVSFRKIEVRELK